MNIKEMSIAEFKEFVSSHFIGNFHESINYAMIKAEEGYDYEFISYGGDEIVGAPFIFYKKIGGYYYGYSRGGFLIDFSNTFYLKTLLRK